ncbi:MAG: shikimate dehydrogenase [Jatrophihabitantaceae bacterium]
MLGKPIGHSLSPVLHRAAYQALGLNWSYSAVECDEDGLADLLARSGPELVGYSCTMPLKRQALRLAATASPMATAIGAANTLLAGPNGWTADNTDWIGIRDALPAGALPAGGSVVLLGAGGTAQAALAALAALSRPGPAAEIVALVREPSRAGELLAAADRIGVAVSIGGLAEASRIGAADLVIATLPAGAADSLATAVDWRVGQVLLEAIYRPWPTPLAQAAARAGAQVVSGARMLLLQAAGQVQLMTGRAAPTEAMRAALLAAVPDCGG